MPVKDCIAELLGEWSVGLNVWSILFRIVLVVAMAAFIGCERSSKRHAAGLRTFILVALGSATAMITDLCIIGRTEVNFAMISAASVIGVSLICGNCILFSSRSQIKGLTTSAGLWACGALGLATGAGLYMVALLAFLAQIVSLAVLPSLERYLKNRSNHFEVHLELKSKANLQDFVATVRKLGIQLEDIESNPAYMNSGLSVYSVSLTILSKELKKYKSHVEIIEALRSLDYIYYIEEMN